MQKKYHVPNKVVGALRNRNNNTDGKAGGSPLCSQSAAAIIAISCAILFIFVFGHLGLWHSNAFSWHNKLRHSGNYVVVNGSSALHDKPIFPTNISPPVVIEVDNLPPQAVIKDPTEVSNGKLPNPPTTPSFIPGEYVAEHFHHQMFVQTITTNEFPINYVWSRGVSSIPTRGVVLLLHGCSAQHMFAWYPHSPNCGNCSGRPMEVGIVKELYRNGFATISTEPFNSKCWSDRKDASNVAKIIGFVYNSLGIRFKDVPLFGIGIANAAKFIVNLGGETSLFGGAAMAGVVCLNGGLWDKPSPVRVYSPILFIDMARNVELCIQNNITVHAFRQLGQSAEQFTLYPQPITPTFFSDADVLSADDSRSLQKILLDDEVIWPGSLILMDSPFSHMAYKFKDAASKALPHIIPRFDNLDRTKSKIFQMFSVAWGLNEVSVYCMSQILVFFAQIPNQPSV